MHLGLFFGMACPHSCPFPRLIGSWSPVGAAGCVGGDRNHSLKLFQQKKGTSKGTQTQSACVHLAYFMCSSAPVSNPLRVRAPHMQHLGRSSFLLHPSLSTSYCRAHDSSSPASPSLPSDDDNESSDHGPSSNVPPEGNASCESFSSSANPEIVSGDLSNSSVEQDSEDENDWRSFRAQLVAMETAERETSLKRGTQDALGEVTPVEARLGVEEEWLKKGKLQGVLWAHEILRPEKGCLLVASDLLKDAGVFERSVVLLLSEEGAEEPFGIIVNHILPKTVGEINTPPFALWEKVFSPARVHLGGPLGQRSVFLLHPHRGLAGHEEVVPGVFFSTLPGMEAAARLVAEEGGKTKVQVEDFKIMVGYAAWGKEQLKQEIGHGWWHVAACSSEVLFQVPSTDLWLEVQRLMAGFK